MIKRLNEWDTEFEEWIRQRILNKNQRLDKDGLMRWIKEWMTK